jgi:hypothetical protein
MSDEQEYTITIEVTFNVNATSLEEAMEKTAQRVFARTWTDAQSVLAINRRNVQVISRRIVRPTNRE